MNWERIGPALDVRPLFARDRAQLLDLLHELPTGHWDRPTVCPGWSVHDLVGHLVHDHLRRLSGTRDGHARAWVVPARDHHMRVWRGLCIGQRRVRGVARGISPRLLTDLIAHLGPQLDQLWSELDLGKLGGAVSWVAPDEDAPLWLDVAREFSEFWIHQQQIRDAVGRPDTQDPKVLVAVVDTLVRSLPRAVAATRAASGTMVTLTVEIRENLSTSWTAISDGRDWHLERRRHRSSAARLHMDIDTFWRLTSRGLNPTDASPRIRREGDPSLTAAAIQLISIIR